jgi:hypothetical protein
VIGNSGGFVTVPPATLSGVVANSGLFSVADVRFVSGSAGAARNMAARYGAEPTWQVDDINGATTAFTFEVTGVEDVTRFSQQELMAVGVTNSGFHTVVRSAAIPNSGYTQLTVFPALPSAPVSGDSFLSLGVSPYRLTSGGFVGVQSGQLSGQLVTAASGSFANVVSGLFTTASLNSGQFVNVYSGQLSGQQVTAASGVFGTASLNSGQFVNVYSGQLSGQLVRAASGVFGTASLNSGQEVLVYSGQLSGQLVVADKAQLSGVIANSGLFVTATATIGSGTVFLASGHFQFGSGQYFLSSGQAVSLNSGQPTLPYSGQVWLSSGQSTATNSGSMSGQSVSLFSGQTVGLYSGLANVTIPDAVLKRPFGSVSGIEVNSGQRSLLNAGRKLVNAWDLTTTSGVLTVFQEDDTTVAYTQQAASASGAEPVTGLT